MARYRPVPLCTKVFGTEADSDSLTIAVLARPVLARTRFLTLLAPQRLHQNRDRMCSY